MRRTAFLLIVLAAALGAQTPAAAIPENISVEKNISYDKYPETVLDILRPREPAKEKRPGMLCIHGGGWINGTKETFVPYCLPYVEKGFVVANIEYRLAKSAAAPAAVTDVLNAAAWFRKHAKQYNVDPNRIAVTGCSAGGHLSLMVGMTPKSAKLGPPAKVAAVVNFYGITDVADQLSGPNMRKYAVAWIPEGPDRLEIAKRVSPMTYVRKDVPPVLTLHGNADQTVPYEHGVALTKALKEAGADATLITVPGGRHGFTKEQLDEVYPQIFQFLRDKKILKQQ